MKNEDKTLTKPMQKSKGSEMAWPVSSKDMDQWFENMFPAQWMNRFQNNFPAWGNFPSLLNTQSPSVDIIDRDDEVLVRAEVAGMKKEDVDLSVTNNSITIKGSVQHDKEEEKGDYYRRETSSGSYSRTLPLPCEVVGDKAKAKFKDGMLEVTIPKVEATKRHKVKVD
jgi:HSP20 family protein